MNHYSLTVPNEPAAPAAQVSRITIGRLYNLGNYEHIRYEITLEVQPGGAEKSLRHLEKILHNINPNRPHGVLSDEELIRQRMALDRALAMSPQDFHKHYPPPYGAKRVGRIERLAEMKRELAEQCERSKEWNVQQRLARAALDAIGGSSAYTDAKDTWDDSHDDDRF